MVAVSSILSRQARSERHSAEPGFRRRLDGYQLDGYAFRRATMTSQEVCAMISMAVLPSSAFMTPWCP